MIYHVISLSLLSGELGNDVSALNSVPAAIFSFLATAQTNYVPPGCEFTENPFERSLALAMSFGGDTDTSTYFYYINRACNI